MLPGSDLDQSFPGLQVIQNIQHASRHPLILWAD
jgi:hypothetical protein